MGVAGCGKTSVGEALAARTGMGFIDSDALHSAESIAKMSRGVPLDDADRIPWLGVVGRVLKEHEGPVAIGCSALKRSYRDIIREGAGEPVFFLHLAAERAVIARRMETREGHFMPPSLLESQFATLEPLEPGETGQAIDIDRTFGEVVGAVAACVRGAAG